MAIPSNRQSYYPTIESDVPANLAIHLRNLYTAINNHDQAIVKVNENIGTTASGTTTQTIIQTTGGGGTLLLQTNGVNNGEQTLLNLIAGTGMTVIDNGVGGITFTPTIILLETNGTPNGSQTLLNLIAGANVTLTDNGSGGVTIAAASVPTVTSNANGWTATFGNGYVEQWGVSAAVATGASTGTVTVTFPTAFAGTPVVECVADNHPSGSSPAVFSCYPTAVSSTGFTANFACVSPATISNVVHANWIAKYHA